MPVYISPTIPPPSADDLYEPAALENWLATNRLNEIIPLVQGIRFEEGYQLIELLRDEGYVW